MLRDRNVVTMKSHSNESQCKLKTAKKKNAFYLLTMEDGIQRGVITYSRIL